MTISVTSQTAPPVRHAACGGTGRPASRLRSCSRRRSESARRARRSRRCRTPRPRPESCWPRVAATCACAPCRGGSNTIGVVVAQFLRHQRTAEQVARLGLDRLQSGGRCRRLLQRRHRAGIAVERRNPRLRRQPQRERPDPAKQIGDVFGALAMFRHQRRQRFLAGDGRLQERTRRQRDLRGADRDRRRRRASAPVRHGASAAPGRCCSATRDSVAIIAGRQRPGAAHVDIEAVVGRGDLDVERLVRSASAARPAPTPHRARRAGRDRGSGSDRPERCRGELAAAKPTLQHVVRAASGRAA